MQDIKNLVCHTCWQDFFTSEKYRLFCACPCTGKKSSDPLLNYADCPGVADEKTMKEIEEGASNNCNWCSYLYTITSQNKDDKNETHVVCIKLHHCFLSHTSPCGRNVLSWTLCWKTSGQKLINHGPCAPRVFTDSEDPAAAFVTARRRQPVVFSAESQKQIQEWLVDCAGHQECPQQSDAPLPTRVIEVAPSTNPEQPRLLVSSGDNTKYGKFMALSYCWGGGCQGALTKSNLNQYTERISTENLAQTFRDAIAVTKATGVPYLWIDALCIVQDDDKDKEHEILAMEQVYQKALLTIIAASSSSSNQGFLAKRAEPEAPSCQIPFYHPENRFGRISFNSESRLSDGEDPIYQRGWTLQEALLGSRFLVYNSATLQWRCRRYVRNLGDSFFQDYSPSMSHLSRTSHNSKQELTRWLGLVEAYSRRNLTLSCDKLNAVSALAKGFLNKLGPHYYAGLWSFSVVSQLAWFCAGPPFDDRPTRPPEYRAPSWSWASRDGPLRFPKDKGYGDQHQAAYMCDFISCDIVPKVEHFPFGEVLSGSLKLKGVLRQAWLKPSSNFPQTTIICFVEDGSLDDVERCHHGPKYGDSTFKVLKRWNARHDDGGDSPTILVNCLPLIRDNTHYCTQSPEETSDYIRGILLVPAKAEPRSFERIGSFYATPGSEFEGLPKREITII